ncbi:MAG: hypothetical protein ACLQPD_04895 [Desulfomonilaceae bacterium]
MKSQINILKLVYPPISNQEAEWIKDDPEVQEQLKFSKLYFICQRAEAFFDYHLPLESLEQGLISFTLYTKSAFSDGVVDISQLPRMKGVDWDMEEIDVEFGPKMFRIWRLDKSTDRRIDVIDWFTTEKILYNRWRRHPAVQGLNEFNEFTRYFLHYVGISKKEDSLTRLVIKPHDKRIRVLSNEIPETQGSRLTDEIILLFFTIDAVRITVMETYHEIDDWSEEDVDLVPIIADAEKAFVKILNASYNTVKYDGYPRSMDGLYGTGLTRYLYVIGEDISLETDSGTIAGGFISDEVWPDSDTICIEGDNVTLEKRSVS